MSISGGSKGVDIGQYLINFNTSEYANQANQYLQGALNQGLQYSEKYNKAALDAQQAFQQQGNQAQMAGYDMAQAIEAPRRLATYQALDKYQDLLGLARPTSGSFQLAGALENQARQQMPGQQQGLLNPQQQQLATDFNAGLLQPVQQGNP